RVAAVEDDPARALRQLAPRRLQVEAEVVGEGAQAVPVEDLAAVRAATRPGGDGALGDRERAVRNDQLGVELLQEAEAAAGGAGAVRGGGREGARLELLEEGAVLRAGELLAEQLVGAAVGEQDPQESLAL